MAQWVDRAARLAPLWERGRQLARNRWLRLSAQTLVLLFCVVYLARSVGNIQELAATIHMRTGLIAGAWLLNLTSTLIGTLSWWLILRGLGESLPWVTAARIHLYANLTKYLPGYAWQLMSKAYLTRQAGVAVEPIALGMSLELLQLVLVGASMSLLIVPAAVLRNLLGSTALLPYLRIAGGLGVVVLCALPWLLPYGLTLARRDRVREGVAPARLWLALPVIAIGWLTFGVSFWMLGSALWPVTPEQLPLFMSTLGGSVLAGLLVVFAPNGIGVRESIMVLVLSAVMPKPYAVVLAALFRLVVAAAEVVATGLARLTLGRQLR